MSKLRCHIGPATAQDLPTLREIERAAGRVFRDIDMAAVADDEPPAVEVLRGYVRAGRAWTSERDGLPVAYLIADVVDGNAHVEQVSVHPDHARHGHGRALLEHLARWAADGGHPALTLTTFLQVPWNGPTTGGADSGCWPRTRSPPACGPCASTKPPAGSTGGRAAACGATWPVRRPSQQEVEMPISVLDMSMSVDGYIAGPDDFLGGDDGERLHHWAAPAEKSDRAVGPVEQFKNEWNAAGAVLAGRRTAELMDHWGGSHHGVPIFVPSHRPPGPAARWGYPLVTYVTDGMASAMKQAKAAAGERDVQVRGAYTAQRAIEAGVLDEVQIHQVPVLLGGGRPLFDVLPTHVELEIARVIDTPEATHIRYRVRR